MADDCEYRIYGTGGGPVRFPTITTNLDADEFGNDQVDFTLFLLGRWVPHKKTFLPRTLP
jgi:hypothetical protein